jgi:DNA-binding IscR family transcriptional regulator
VSQSELVANLNLPKEFLSQILHKLKAGGILQSVRGKREAIC